MKLLFVLPEYVGHAGGGIVTFYRSYLPALAAAGHEVHVIVGSGVTCGERAAHTIDGVQVETLDADLFNAHLPRFARYGAVPVLRRALAAAWAMWQQARKGEGYDLVEAADWGLLFLPWVIECGPPCVAQLHGSMGQIDWHDPVAGEDAQGALLRLIERAGIARADCAQAYSESNAMFWREQAGCEVQCILPAWRSLDPAAGVVRSTQGIVVARVQRWKGPEVLCEAQRRLGERAPTIAWVGRDTPFGDRGTSTVEQLRRTYPDVWGRTVLNGPQVSNDEVTRLQARAMFAVVPSLWDTFNFACVEAMGVGTPTVCSTGAGASQLIENGVNGFTFASGHADALAGVLARMLALGERELAMLGDEGRMVVRERLDPPTVAELRAESYASILKRARPAPLPENDWLRLACAPARAGKESMEFLEQLPLKPLAGHVLRRLTRKLGL